MNKFFQYPSLCLKGFKSGCLVAARYMWSRVAYILRDDACSCSCIGKALYGQILRCSLKRMFFLMKKWQVEQIMSLTVSDKPGHISTMLQPVSTQKVKLLYLFTQTHTHIKFDWYNFVQPKFSTNWVRYLDKISTHDMVLVFQQKLVLVFCRLLLSSSAFRHFYRHNLDSSEKIIKQLHSLILKNISPIILWSDFK